MERRIGRTRPATLAGMLLAVALLAWPAAAHALPADQAVHLLNLQRAANGIPPLALDHRLNVGCAAHNRYMRLHGMDHGEDPGRPGYTPEGAGLNGHGGSEVLASDTDGEWGAGFAENPWIAAPLHLALMFDPSATLAGYDDSVYGCMRFSGFRPLPGAFSLPAPGARGVPARIVASEWPFTPAEALGTEAAAGFNAIVWAPGRTVVSAALAGPEGPEPVRVLTTGTPTPQGPWRGDESYVVPEQPYLANADYLLTVVWADGFVQHVPFRTSAERAEVDVAQPQALVRDVSVEAYASSPITAMWARDPAGRRLRGRIEDVSVDGFDKRLEFARSRPGRYTICAEAGGGRSGYVAARDCRRVRLRGAHRVSVRRVRGGVRITASRSARGLRATVKLTRGHTPLGEIVRWQKRIRLRGSVFVRTPRGRFRSVWVEAPARRTRYGSYLPVTVQERYSRARRRR